MPICGILMQQKGEGDMRILLGFFLAALSITGFAATFVFGGALTKECGVSPDERISDNANESPL